VIKLIKTCMLLISDFAYQNSQLNIIQFSRSFITTKHSTTIPLNYYLQCVFHDIYFVVSFSFFLIFLLLYNIIIQSFSSYSSFQFLSPFHLFYHHYQLFQPHFQQLDFPVSSIYHMPRTLLKHFH